MSLQVSLRLKLSKNVMGITVKYNTFEKATYDQYLVSSIFLRAKDKQQAIQYIDDITGFGSLNAHFKNLLNETEQLTEEQLIDIMKNSMYPLLKIDKSNKYDYYTGLNVSVFNNKVYEGDFGTYPDLIERLYIQEKVIEQNINIIKELNNLEPYSVLFDDNGISVRIADKWIKIDNNLFMDSFINELNTIDKYQGKIHKGADGIGWNTLTNSTINNMFSDKNYYYDENGDHCKIRNENIRKSVVSEIEGFYIYKEEIVNYNNKEICSKVLNTLINNKTINEFKTKSLLYVLKYVEDKKAQEVINYLLERKESKELALFGIELLSQGLEKGWGNEALKSFMKFADSGKFSLIYKANPELCIDIEQLILVNPDYLTATHKKQVEKYKNDKQQKIDLIIKIIGEVTTSGFREGIKKIKSDRNTKRATVLMNNLIGHNKNNISEVSMSKIDGWLKNAIELKDLTKVLQPKIKKETK